MKRKTAKITTANKKRLYKYILDKVFGVIYLNVLYKI